MVACAIKFKWIALAALLGMAIAVLTFVLKISSAKSHSEMRIDARIQSLGAGMLARRYEYWLEVHEIVRSIENDESAIRQKELLQSLVSNMTLIDFTKMNYEEKLDFATHYWDPFVTVGNLSLKVEGGEHLLAVFLHKYWSRFHELCFSAGGEDDYSDGFGYEATCRRVCAKKLRLWYEMKKKSLVQLELRILSGVLQCSREEKVQFIKRFSHIICQDGPGGRGER